MIIQPKIRGFICTTAHPKGCSYNVQSQIDFVEARPEVKNGPKKVLVIGASNGYGLASRIVSSFGGSNAATIGVFLEKESDGKRTATAGFYNNLAFEKKAKEQGLYAKSINGDAFSDEIKAQTAELIKKDLGKVDLVIYSLASPRRTNPKTQEISRSVLKPIGQDLTCKNLDVLNRKMETITLIGATEQEINDTVTVMGGEDWELWIDYLLKEDLLEEGALTVAYSYIGPEVTQAIYRNGTIGRAKEHLEATAVSLTNKLSLIKAKAYVSVNKALVTQSSSAIPVIPLYFAILYKVMKSKNVHEDCIAQVYRLFADKMCGDAGVVVDENGLIRMDDWELCDDVQNEVNESWSKIDENNFEYYADLDGYIDEFMKLFGFRFESVNYEEDVDPINPF